MGQRLMADKVELISKSANRLMGALELQPRDKMWWWFMRRESWIHLKRSWELFWMVLRRKEAKQKTLQVRKEYNQKLRELELDRGNSTG